MLVHELPFGNFRKPQKCLYVHSFNPHFDPLGQFSLLEIPQFLPVCSNISCQPRLVLGLGQGRSKSSNVWLEQKIRTFSKNDGNMLFEKEESVWRGSHWPSMGQYGTFKKR